MNGKIQKDVVVLFLYNGGLTEIAQVAISIGALGFATAASNDRANAVEILNDFHDAIKAAFIVDVGDGGSFCLEHARWVKDNLNVPSIVATNADIHPDTMRKLGIVQVLIVPIHTEQAVEALMNAIP